MDPAPFFVVSVLFDKKAKNISVRVYRLKRKRCYITTLHYAPIEVTKSGNPRVVKQGKFQVVHPVRQDKIAQGYQVALTGELIETKPLN